MKISLRKVVEFYRRLYGGEHVRVSPPPTKQTSENFRDFVE